MTWAGLAIGLRRVYLLVTLSFFKACLLKPASVRAKLFMSCNAVSNCVLLISASRPSLSSENPSAFDLSKFGSLWYSFN